jgi:hypothetical protein
MSLYLSKYYIFLLLVFFPFISFGTNSMDTQPWILIYALFFHEDFFSSYRNSKIILGFLLLLFVLQFFVFLIYFKIDFFYFTRGISGYLIFLMIYFFQKKNLYTNFIQKQRLIFIINYVYLFVAIGQIIISPFITENFVNVRTSDSRGVTSLTPEPTMFGIFLIFLSLIYTIIWNTSNKNKIVQLIILNSISILFLAKSSTASLYLIIGIIFWIFINIKAFKILFYSIVIFPFAYFIFFFYITSYLGNARIGYIFNSIFSGDILILLGKDKSIQDRILANIFPFKASYNNYFIPGGFNLELTLKAIDINFLDLTFTKFHTGSRIMSLWGSSIAELGFLFILIFIGYSYYLFKDFRSLNMIVRKKIVFIYFMIVLLGFTSFTISFPLLAFILASIPILKKTSTLYSISNIK